MILRDLLAVLSTEKRKKERVKAAQKYAIGIGVAAAAGVAAGILFAPKPGKETREDLMRKSVSTVEAIKATVQKKAETVKDSAAHAAQEICNIVQDVHGNMEGVKRNMNDYCHETQDS